MKGWNAQHSEWGCSTILFTRQVQQQLLSQWLSCVQKALRWEQRCLQNNYYLKYNSLTSASRDSRDYLSNNLLMFWLYLGSTPQGRAASQVEGNSLSCLCHPLSSPSSPGSQGASSSAGTPALLRTKLGLCKLVALWSWNCQGCDNNEAAEEGSREPKEGADCVGVTSVCRPVPEDLQRTLRVVQNDLLASAVVLLLSNESRGESVLSSHGDTRPIANRASGHSGPLLQATAVTPVVYRLNWNFAGFTDTIPGKHFKTWFIYYIFIYIALSM